MTAPPAHDSPRDLRRRQRQVTAYLSELRAAHGREESRLRRALRPKRRKPAAAPAAAPARPDAA